MDSDFAPLAVGVAIALSQIAALILALATERAVRKQQQRADKKDLLRENRLALELIRLRTILLQAEVERAQEAAELAKQRFGSVQEMWTEEPEITIQLSDNDTRV
jgi:hypothetical protein